MPASQLHFPAPGLALDSSYSRMKTDDKLLHDELTKRDARHAGPQPPLKLEPRFSHKEVGTFHFHRTELLGDGSALLLNLRGVELLHKGSIEQIDARSKYPIHGERDDEGNENTNVGDRVWVPHHVSETIDVSGYTRSSAELTNKYYPARILSGWNYGGGDLCNRIMVEFDGGNTKEVHIGDIRETPPPARGRGGDKRFLCNFTIWAPPFRRWHNDEIKVNVNTKWTPGETIQRIVGGLEVQFTVPEDLDKLPWNKEKTARCFTLKMPGYVKAQEWKYKVRDWDIINRKAEEQLKKYPMPKDGSRRLPDGVEELYHSGEAKMFVDSPFPHYRANVEKANPDGTIVLSFKNGYTIQDYNPDWISDDYLDKINYRAPRGGTPYNPPEFEEGEYVNIDYERTGKPVYSVILEKNANGTYKTESRYRRWSHYHQDYTMGDKVVDEETTHDIIYKEVDSEWGFRTGFSLGRTIPPMEKGAQKTIHRKLGRDKEQSKSVYKKIHSALENDGILSWATWFRRSEKVKNINLTQMCLGQIDYYSETAISVGGGRGSYIMKPAIFAWSTWEKEGNCSDTVERGGFRPSREQYQWIPLKTITEKDVNGVPLLEAFYKKALKNHGCEEGNADLFASSFMEFAKGRNKGTLRRWRPQEFQTEEESLEKTPEEKRFDLLLSANVRLEKKNREMEEMVMNMDKKMKSLKNRSGRAHTSTIHEMEDYKDWTEKTIDRKIGDYNQRLGGLTKKVEKHKEDSAQFLKYIALGWAGIYVIECAMKYWSTPRMIE